MWLSEKQRYGEDVEVVECYECNSLVKKDKSQSVDLFRCELNCCDPYHYKKTERHFCLTHSKKYTKIYTSVCGQNIFYRELQVDALGEPIGYTKIEKKEVEPETAPKDPLN